MSILVPITMFGWIPLVLLLFSKLKPQRAVITAFLVAWLFLPEAKYEVSGLPNYTKMTATCWGVFIAAFFFDRKRLYAFRLKPIDLPMLLWCMIPIASSLSNGLGFYDGFSFFFRRSFTWGAPYLIGRVYFNELKALKELSFGIFIGGLVYIPFCLFENIMSPQLHNLVYGFHQHSFNQSYRWGGWRPMVFMEHGLMVGVWMMAASLIGFWMLLTGSVKKILGLPLIWPLSLLFITFAMARSTGAWALSIIGAVVLVATRQFKRPVAIICLAFIPVIYMGLRSTGSWTGYNLQEFIADNISVERAYSLRARMENENILVEKALQRPVVGWGGWGRSRVYDDAGKDISITDGFWVIIMGQNGLLGLGAFTVVFLLPCFIFARVLAKTNRDGPSLNTVAPLALLIVLYMIDNLLNAMINPIFTVVAGGLSGLNADSLNVGKTLIPRKKTSCGNSLEGPRFL